MALFPRLALVGLGGLSGCGGHDSPTDPAGSFGLAGPAGSDSPAYPASPTGLTFWYLKNISISCKRPSCTYSLVCLDNLYDHQ